jgi:hypothetical protein
MYAYTWEGAPSGSHTLTAHMIYTGSSVSISAPLTIEIVP